MTEEKCIACDKVIGDNPVFWDVSGGYWCESCGFKEIIDDLRNKLDRTELAEAKARMEIEDLGEYFNALLGQRIRHLDMLRAENNRLRAALEFYADEKHYEPYNFNCYGCDVTEDEGIIARTALAGDSNAI